MRLLQSSQLDDQTLFLRDPACVAFVRDCILAQGQKAIRNVVTEMQILDTEQFLFPVSINNGGELPDNSYVVSPLTTYIGYAREELSRLHNPWLTWPLGKTIDAVGGWFKEVNIDRIVQVNNWLLSTNIYPDQWNGENLADITEVITSSWPSHAVGFRSLNRFSNRPLIERFQALGYLAVPSRQVYLFNTLAGSNSHILKHHNVKLDSALLRRSKYRVICGEDLRDSDFERLEQLYSQLYLAKYCRLNPQYTADWLRCGQRNGWLRIRALVDGEGRIDGVLGWFGGAETLTAPIVGYDTTLPQKLGLYRLLTHLCITQALDQRVLLNFSSGAAQFKRLRGGQPEIEYSMVFVRHLPRYQQRAWKTLAALLSGLGIPLMRTLKL